MKSKFLKIVLTIVSLALLLAIVGAVVYVEGIQKSENYAHFDKSKLAKAGSNVTILDDNGRVLEDVIYYNNIKQVSIANLPKHVYMAFVAVEDKRFYSHHGIDLTRVCGAIVSNIKAGSFKEGASTISQQLIKNTHLDNSKKISRKVNEMLLAKELENNYNKEQILQIYLNTIYFGRNAYGIENAANVYFGKSAKQLSLSESALLAGMIKAPNVYAPDKNIEKCKSRRNIVLNLMLEQGIISNEQHLAATSEEVTYIEQNRLVEKTYMYYALKEACEILNMTECQLLNSGYTIETFCNQQIQSDLCQVARNDTTLDKNGKLSSLACVISNNQGHVVGCYMRGENADIKGQVGSTLKPIAVYAPALNERIVTQASPILDEQTNFNGYKPQNVNGYCGWTTIKNAVTKSLNVPAVKTLNCLTLPIAEQYLTKLGFVGKQDLSLALGNIKGGATPFDLLRCYTSLSNNGNAAKTRFVKSISKDNATIYKAEDKTTQVFSPRTAFLMTDMLINVVQNGTAKGLKKEYQVAAKTGTVGDKLGNSDALVAGYTTQHTFVVWHRGEFDNSVVGANAPCKVASKLLDKVYQAQTPIDFASPNGVVQLTLEENELLLNQNQVISNKGVTFWFDVANKPTQTRQKEAFEYHLQSKMCADGMRFWVENVPNGKWELVQELGAETKIVQMTNNEYLYNCEADCAFYARLVVDGKVVYRTPKVEVAKASKTPQNCQQDGKSLLDFWYLR